MGNKGLFMAFGYLAVASIFVAIAIFLFKSSESNEFDSSQSGSNSGLSYNNSLDKDRPSTTSAGNVIGESKNPQSDANSREDSDSNNNSANVQTPNSNNNQINPIEKPSSTTQATTAKTTTAGEKTELRININTASKSELCKLNGIGDVKASSIITYREANNGFKNIEEIKNVSGIGDAIFAKISPFIYVGNPQYPAQTTAVSDTQETSPSSQEKININTAGLTELQKIKGVGPKIAQKIIDYREENGSFKSIEEIVKVSGIGSDKFENMKDQITV